MDAYNKMLKTGNVGEWSEIYTLFKVLGDSQLYAGNASLEKIDGVIFPVIKVLRTEVQGNLEYMINKDLVFISSNGATLLKLPVLTFVEKAQETLESILENKAKKQATFSIPEIEKFMDQIHCNSLKAISSSKSDITIVIHDEITNQNQELGFSIKSQLGSASTLLNPGKTTNFKFLVKGISSRIINTINQIANPKKIIKRVNAILSAGGNFSFHSMENKIFLNNLALIDSALPQILAHILLIFNTTKYKTIRDIIEQIELENPLGFDQSDNHKFYEYKIKRFLTDVALGMTPSKVWNGTYDATGGYLVVKDDGEIVCYHIYNKNEFEDYLFYNTKLDSASTTRYGFAELYKENNVILFNLNLQIRFLK
jgi:hypothetical protein